jgi:hypothetical protein
MLRQARLGRYNLILMGLVVRRARRYSSAKRQQLFLRIPSTRSFLYPADFGMARQSRMIAIQRR